MSDLDLARKLAAEAPEPAPTPSVVTPPANPAAGAQAAQQPAESPEPEYGDEVQVGADIEADDGLEAVFDPRALEAEVKRIRAFRQPMGLFAQKLALPKRRGYHRHWFGDVAGRVSLARANGWSHIKGTDGKPLTRSLGTSREGGGLMGYAMEIPEVFWKEDMAARHKEASDRMASIKKNPIQAAPGTARPQDDGKFYSPDGQTYSPNERGAFQARDSFERRRSSQDAEAQE